LTSQEITQVIPPNGKDNPPPQDQAASSGSANASNSGGASPGQGTTGATDSPPLQNVQGSSKYLGLPQRDRDALLQAQRETWPPEYAPAIEQYLRNLSDQSTPAAR
jgi:hypothetical protein